MCMLLHETYKYRRKYGVSIKLRRKFHTPLSSGNLAQYFRAWVRVHNDFFLCFDFSMELKIINILLPKATEKQLHKLLLLIHKRFNKINDVSILVAQELYYPIKDVVWRIILYFLP